MATSSRRPFVGSKKISLDHRRKPNGIHHTVKTSSWEPLSGKCCEYSSDEWQMLGPTARKETHAQDLPSIPTQDHVLVTDCALRRQRTVVQVLPTPCHGEQRLREQSILPYKRQRVNCTWQARGTRSRSVTLQHQTLFTSHTIFKAEATSCALLDHPGCLALVASISYRVLAAT